MRATTTNGAARARSFGRAVAALGVTAVAGLALLPTMAVPASAASADPAPVTIQDFKFTPASVPIPVGTTVRWTNEGRVQHTVTADDKNSAGQPLFDQPVDPGSSFSFTFNEATTYTYHCRIHPSMTGTIVVEASTTTTSAAPTTTTTAPTTTSTTAQVTTTTAPSPSSTAAPATTATTAHRTTTTTRPVAPSTTRATAASTTTTAPPAPAPTDTTAGAAPGDAAGADHAVPAGSTPAPAGTTPSTEVANGVAVGPGSGGSGGAGRAAALGLGAAAIVAVSGAGWWTLRRRRSAH